MLTDEQVVECRLDAERGLEDGHYILQELSQDILALLTDRAELVAEVERLEAAYMQMGMRAAELEYTVQHHEAEIGRLRAVVEAAKAAIGECAWTPKCDALAALEVGE